MNFDRGYEARNTSCEHAAAKFATVSLSVLVPVYNEQHLVYASLQRLKVLEHGEHLERVQVIVVDDCSTDRSPAILQRFKDEQTGDPESRIQWTFLTHPKNMGKGQAVRTALEFAACDVAVIHDADLEYHPRDLLRMVDVFIEEDADAVFGSRFAGGERRRVLFYRHQLGNRLLTTLSNLVTNLNLTDMETCYKAVRTSLLKSIPIESNDFRIEPELTIKLAKRQARIFEVPISYSGRSYEEGKKINWRDGFRALAAIVKFGLSDSIYQRDTYGSHTLARLSRAPRFNDWMADAIRKHCGSRILEIGSGTGNLTKRLAPRARYVASDINPHYLKELETLSSDRPYMQASFCDVTDESSFPRIDGGFDTVVCLNVIEHVEPDRTALANIRSVLVNGGKAVILVPQGQWNFGTLDIVLGHYRRYSKESLARVATAAGFVVNEMFEFNRIGTAAWFLNGKIMRRKTFGLVQIWMLDKLMPVFRLIDPLLPIPALSLIAILERREGVAGATVDVEADASIGVYPEQPPSLISSKS
jgi:glycosyltransferase involved in cell wall biosynthesis